MTSSPKRTLPAVLSTLAIAFAAAEARAADDAPASAPTETIPAPAAAPAATVTLPAGTGGFGDAASWYISPERLFGFSWRHQTLNPKSTTAYSIFALPLGLANAGYSWPRLAFDYFVTQGISIGAAASFSRASGNGASATIFELAPRVGYATRLGPLVSWWPRLGFTYVHIAQGATESFSAVTLDLPLVLTPWSKPVALTVGPSLDLGVAGSLGNASNKVTDVSLMFGLIF